MDKGLLRYFWDCGDDQIIQFAITRAHLNRIESDVIHLMLDECLSQEEVAEKIGYSTRRTQEFWYSASKKLLNIPWVYAYAKQIKESI